MNFWESAATLIWTSLVFIIPAYLGNAAPSIVGGGRPIDGGKNWFDGRPILGPHKTIRGLLGGIVAAFAGGLILYFVPPFSNTWQEFPFYLPGLLGVGANFGDLSGSFLKRRLNRPSGAPFIPYDQLGFVLYPVLLGLIFGLSLGSALLILIVSPLVHICSNIVAYYLKIKDVWW